MSLEFEKLTGEIEKMAQGAVYRQGQRQTLVEAALEKLALHASDWASIELGLGLVQSQVDPKLFRAARPVEQTEPLNIAVDPPPPPPQATLIATDGSQIMPDRHAAHLYYLTNVGTIVYFHGQGCPPFSATYPTLGYPNGEEGDLFVEQASVVTIWRDLAEIEVLAEMTEQHRGQPRPAVAILDQRLLYWPTSGGREGARVLAGWQKAMSRIRQSGSFLVGYIDKPGKRSVMNLLHALDSNQPDFDWSVFTQPTSRPEPTDTDLFSQLLRPGQRSKVFADVSQHNYDFSNRDPDNEVCFFYLNPGRAGRQIARVDIPIAVAKDPSAVAAVHSLLYDQCQILGDYPYVLTRADEIAFVGGDDQASLTLLIDNAMQQVGLEGDITAKQSGKEIARANKTRHEVKSSAGF